MTIILRETYATVNRLNDIRIFGGNRNKCEIDIHVTISHFFDDAYSRAHSPRCAHSCTSIHKYANKIVHLPTTPNIFTRMHIWNTINRAFAKIQLGIMHFNCKYTHTHAQIKYHLYRMKYESNKLNEMKKQQQQPESNFVETIQYDF